MGSPWEKYADPAAAAPWTKYAAPTAPAGPGQGDMRAAPTAPEQPGYAKDMLYSVGSGVVRGAVETAMLPITANRLGQQGASWAMGAGDDLVRSIIGADPSTPEDVNARQSAFDQSQEAIAQVMPFGRLLMGPQAADAQDAVRGAMDANLYEPQTTPGRYAETIGEFALPGSIPSKAVRAAPTVARKVAEYIPDLFRNVALPGALSEGAGQAAEGMGADGTWKETLARVGGAVAGGVGSAAVKAANAPDRVIRRATGELSDEEWARALELQNNQFGVKLTGPEAISQARNGGTGLTDVQRVVEGSIEGAAGMNPFFAQRPDQLKAATNSWLDSIAPQSAAPSTLGPRASEAATKGVLDVEKARTAAVEPLYRAADPNQVPAPELQALADDMAATAASDKTGIVGGQVDGLRAKLFDKDGNLITDIANLDRLRKDARDRLGMQQVGADAISKEQAGALSGYLERLDALMEKASPDFKAAKGKYAEQTRDVVQPVAEGPLGAIAAAKDTTAAGNALLPPNPLVGSEAETADAIRRLIMQDADTTRGLARQTVADRFGKAMTETQAGDATFGGAKFRKAMMGNDQRKATLDEALAALQVPEAAAASPALFDVMQATGRRKPIGSQTEFNRSINADLGEASPIASAFNVAKTAGVSWLTKAGDALQRTVQRKSLGDLADMFTDPQSVELIKAAIARGANTGVPEAVARVAAQIAATRGQ